MDELSFLPPEVRHAAEEAGKSLCEIRLRRGKPVFLTLINGQELILSPLSDQEFSQIASNLMGHSLYARENELAQGFLTLKNGCRAGISGNFTGRDGRINAISDINSICIRFAREIKGCADNIMDHVRKSRGFLIVSPPGLGKTTLLRDIVRILSEEGQSISLMDERGEIAACEGGSPQLDVGPRTDIFSLCAKSAGIMMAIRAMAPHIIAADEIGTENDASSISEASRSGVKIIATCHGNSFSFLRPSITRLILDGVFDSGALLGPSRGEIMEIKQFDGGNL